MKPDPDRQALMDQMTQRFRKKLEEHYTDDTATLEQIEEAVEKIGQDILPELQKKLVNKRAKKARDNKIDCSCGKKARYRGMETKTLITCHGRLDWTRPPITVTPAGRDRLPWTVVWDWIKARPASTCACGWPL